MCVMALKNIMYMSLLCSYWQSKFIIFNYYNRLFHSTIFRYLKYIDTLSSIDLGFKLWEKLSIDEFRKNLDKPCLNEI